MRDSKANQAIRRAIQTAVADARRELSLRKSDALRLVLAVSGGEDSVSLLYATHALRDELGFEMSVAHFNHSLRHESEMEAVFVKVVSDELELPFQLGIAPERDESLNLEAWARTERYRFLEAVRGERSADLILTAHHLNDQAETLLFRCLSGRLATDAHTIAYLDLRRHLLRPLLSISRETISNYCDENDLDFVQDSSNSDESRTRNRIRHTLLPLLQREFNPRVVENLGLLAERLKDDEDFIWEQALEQWERDGEPVEVSYLAQCEPALAWRTLKLIAIKQTGDAGLKLGFGPLSRIAERLQARSETNFEDKKIFELGVGIVCNFGGEVIKFSFAAGEMAESDECERSEKAMEVLAIPGFVERRYQDGALACVSARTLTVNCAETVGVIERARKDAESADWNHATAYFDLNQLRSLNLFVRERREGDELRIFRRGSRKLKKLLQEKGLEREHRDSLPIVVDGDGEILWVPRVGRSELAPISSESREVLELSYTRTPSADRSD